MSDGPPDWGDVPTGEYGPQGGGGGKGGGKARRNDPPAMTDEQMAAATSDFYEWLETPATLEQLKIMLPDHVDPAVFLATAKTAVLTRPQLLREDLRQSLLTSVMKAAGQGLLPDGKQGALVARYDTEAKKYAVAWQPMVWGITKLGRETGAIRSIRAVIVFHGETFRIIQGEEDRIEHEVDPDIVEEAYGALNGGKGPHGPIAKPAAFMDRVRAAYCFITGMDGTVTKRWMTKQRLISLWESSKAANGPWNSRWIDEMICKGVILYTAKWINLDTESATAKRFQAALMTDMEVDFDRQGQLTASQERPQQAALPAPDKLSTMEDAIMGGMTKKAVSPREKAPATNVSDGGNPAQDRAGVQGEGKAGSSLPSSASKPAEDASFLGKVTQALESRGSGHSWMKAFTAATKAVETAGDLMEMGKLPSVVANKKDAPPAYRSEIADLLAAASQRLAEVGRWHDPEQVAAE